MNSGVAVTSNFNIDKLSIKVDRSLRLFFLVFIIAPLASSGQVHPDSYDPGIYSEKTLLPYTRDPAVKDKAFLIYESDKTTAKLFFYEGKYDPWRSSFNKNNPLFDQIYIFPPGTLPVSKGVFLDQTEVANIHYLEFLYYVEKDSGKAVSESYQPRLENKFRKNYFDNPDFSFFPVIGVSHKDAEDYCKWRAKKLNPQLKEMLIGSPKKYRYAGRLPKIGEWQKAAGKPADFVKDVHYSLGKDEKKYIEARIIPNRYATAALLEKDELYGYNANFFIEPPIGLEIEIPMYLYSFEPNERGFYNMYGNVKELLDDGHAIGGSFLTPYKPDILFEEDDIQAYRTDVGFRCICEIARRRR